MYLKSIEIHGFKSFANKMVFKFDEGITGIVGPNGSGKSNVADAVRWVLGEQRIKQLRGASMQDVIFSGTEMRKPMSYAYVAITLDNSDHQLQIAYDEVTIARRIYRSGESEYLINGTIVRLKDVNELFYDTGIGKEGYSIIGQGQIDKILSGKPEERRELFDEAAGIVKFKHRKDTAQKKLMDEEGNLVRVKDIIKELESRVGPLEKQSETAKEYLRYKEELKTLDVNVFLLENNHLKEQYESVSEKHKIASDDYKATEEKFEAIKNEYEDIEGQIALLNEKIEAARNNLSNTSILSEKLEGEILVLREQINSSKNAEESLKQRIASIDEDIEKREISKTEILAEKEKNENEAASLSSSRDEAASLLKSVQLQIEDLTTKIENGKNRIIDELNRRAGVKADLGRYDTMKEQINIRKAELNSKLLRAKSDEEKQDEEIERLVKEHEILVEKISSMNETLKDKEAKVEKVRSELSDMDKSLREAQMLHQQGKSKLDALVNLTERYEGYGGSVKKVMEQKDANKGIIGVVADIIKTESEYETAIETALGGNIQNIVTDDEATAKKMITYLKKNQLGRATFLPLTDIKNPQEFKTPEVLKEAGVIGMADSLVTTEKKYADVAKAMLGRIVVVDHMDNALSIARKYDFGIRMVTLEGELLVPGGAISGGTFRNNSNLLSRRREISELEETVKKFAEKIDKLNATIEEKKTERNMLRMEAEELKATIQRSYIEENTAEHNVNVAKEKKNEAILGSKQLVSEGNQIEVQLAEIEAKKQEISLSLNDSEELEKRITREVEDCQATLEDTRIKESEFSSEVSNWELSLNRVLQKKEFTLQNLSRIEGEINKLISDKEEINNNLKECGEDILRKESNIEEIKLTIAAGHDSYNKEQSDLTQNIELRESLSDKQKNFFKNREDLSERISALDKEIFRLQSQMDKIDESIETQISYMWSEYEITLSDAASLRDEEMNDLNAMKKSINHVKDAIKKLGNVNVNAIEEYRELMERYTFMKTQHDDLAEAKAQLETIIAELDEAMRKQFTESFKDINTEFDKVFKELFGGGKGTLELIEEEDVLDAGIRIIAQPPGKKLQNMMQLSGGEKALTAIALLFAIQNLKPSPFCLLDEIEAALDESNVDRFAKYLHKLTKHTQFIVITHRRGTMERSDRLYGITMQEKGVSTLVSVNLIDKDLDD